MNQLRVLLPRLWKLMRAHPKTTLTAALSLVAVTWGVWSCQNGGVSRMTRDTGARAAAEPEVRIRIRSGVQAAKLEGPKRFTFKPVGGLSRELEGPVSLSIGADGARVADARGAIPSPGWTPFEIGAVADVDATPRIRIDTSLYPGKLRILPRRPGSLADSAPDARMDIVAITGIEDYLVGVVASELYPDWKSHGVFEVQAICARTYALHQRQRSIDARQEWDLESTEEDQAYKGGTFKTEAYRGVQDTRGVVLTWNGKLLRTYYSSTCGGRTSAAADVWPTTPGYEFNLASPIQAHSREHQCQNSPRYRWQVTRDRDALSRQLREFGKSKGLPLADCGVLKSLAVERANRDDRPSSYAVTDASGRRFSVSAEQLRLACNVAAAGVPAVTRETRVLSGDLEMDIQGKTVVIRGRGFGHGVGMCQFCAKAMADRGDSWQTMITRFYPGSKVERAY